MFTLPFVLLFSSLSHGGAINDLSNVGRSIDGLSRANHMNSLNEPYGLNSNKTIDMAISADDLYSELTYLWDRKANDSNQVFLQIKNDSTKENFKNIDFQVSPMSTITENTLNNLTASQPSTYDPNTVNHWMRIRGIAANMKSLLLRMYGGDVSSSEAMNMFNMVDKLLEIGDKINIMSIIENNFDIELIDFLKKKWSNVEGELQSDYPLLASVLAVDVKELFITVAKGLVKQFGNIFRKQALVHLSEQDLVLETMRSTGFKDSEIYDVFMILGLPIDVLITTSNTLENEARSYGIASLFSRKGHGGGHGGGYGYEMMTKDPFLILAGLALAAFAAYIIYRLLLTTVAPSMRSASYDFLSLDLSDMSEIMTTNVYNLLDRAESLYEYLEEENMEKKVSFSEILNLLWRSYTIDGTSGSCIRRFLCQYVHDNKFEAISSGMNIDQLAILGLAELLGEKGAGKTMDRYITKLISGEKGGCNGKTDFCDENEFSSIFRKSTNQRLKI